MDDDEEEEITAATLRGKPRPPPIAAQSAFSYVPPRRLDPKEHSYYYRQGQVCGAGAGLQGERRLGELGEGKGAGCTAVGWGVAGTGCRANAGDALAERPVGALSCWGGLAEGGREAGGAALLGQGWGREEVGLHLWGVAGEGNGGVLLLASPGGKDQTPSGRPLSHPPSACDPSAPSPIFPRPTPIPSQAGPNPVQPPNQEFSAAEALTHPRGNLAWLADSSQHLSH